MKICIASDSFKGSSTSQQAGEQMARGIRRVFPDASIKIIPIGDGGEGTVEAVIMQMGGSMREITAAGPLGEPVKASYGIAGSTAVIEMAAASGLTLVPEEKRNPLITTTYGTGEMILDAVRQGCTRILVAIGGSATNDGGVGMAQALGYSFTGSKGNEIGYGGGSLDQIESIDASIAADLSGVEIEIMCDVSNPLCGPKGASAVYGPQKGATEEMARQLDANLNHLARKTEEFLGIDCAEIPGSGAAGGLGFGLTAFAGGTLRSGIEAVLEAISFSGEIKDMDLLITGEGKMDGQSIFGKAPVGAAQAAKRLHIPVIAIAGSIGEGIEAVYDHGIDSVMSIVNRPMSLTEAFAESSELLADAAERAMRMIRIGMGLH